MNGEQLLKAVLNAPPAIRAKLELVLNGDESVVPPPIADARTCSQSEAARRLNLSRGTVVGWMKKGLIETINVSGVPRVLLSSLDAIARGRVDAADDPETARWIAARAARRAEAGRRGAAARMRKRNG